MTYRYSLQKNKGYSFTAHNGTYWITFEGDGQDYIIQMGESLEITGKQGLMLIQNLDGIEFGFEFHLIDQKGIKLMPIKLIQSCA